VYALWMLWRIKEVLAAMGLSHTQQTLVSFMLLL
jgi:hypothetical protein